LKTQTRQQRYRLNNPEHVLVHGAKHRAKKLNIPFSLTHSDITVPDTCPVLGIPLKAHVGGRSGYFPDSPTLDRIVPSLGYVPGNVRVISARANLIKRDATVVELEKILEYARANSGV
jgi:hypothetical protein